MSIYGNKLDPNLDTAACCPPNRMFAIIPLRTTTGHLSISWSTSPPLVLKGITPNGCVVNAIDCLGAIRLSLLIKPSCVSCKASFRYGPPQTHI